MEENINLSKIKKEKIKLVVLVVSILMIASSVTYAFFVSGVSDPANTDVNLGTEVSGGLVFTPGTPINLTANLTNFAEGDGSLSGETTSTANLKAASSTGSATENYYIYYNVTSNNFVYTKDNTTPELLLTITDPEGNEITTLTNHPELTHKTVTDALTGDPISGFDVTTYEGLILIDDSYTISTTDSTVGTTQEWKAKLTFVNLDTVQTANEGKVFGSHLMLRIDEYSFPIADGILMYNGGIEEIEAKSIPNFSLTATVNEGMFSAEDDYGTSYYFRGAVDNNWVEFAGFYWRIIRINGDKSVRMIYAGNIAPTEEQKVFMPGGIISPKPPYGYLPYGIDYEKAEHIGYKYRDGAGDGTSFDSSIKILVDNWYEENIFNKNYHNYISDVIYCNDRSAYSVSGIEIANPIGSGNYRYGFRIRSQNRSTITLSCPRKADAFTVDDSVNGVKALKYPVALITGDELIYAGFGSDGMVADIYLRTNSSFWTLSPNSLIPNTNIKDVFYINVVHEDGYMFVIDAASSSSPQARPVLSLKPDTLVTGKGLWNDPYVVE